MAVDGSDAAPATKSSGERVRCANCDIEIAGSPVMQRDRPYCCEGCAVGGPCIC